MREHRSTRAEVRVPDGEDGRTFEAVVLRYNTVDDYGTRFRPGCFTASLEARLPRIVWAHDWREPVGRYVDYVDDSTELRLVGEFDDFAAVPRARQASAQLRSGTIDQFSVGFVRLADEATDPDEVDGLRGIMDITKATLDEASLVLVGAVPGTKLVSVRGPDAAVVDTDALIEIAKRKAAGELTDAEAEAALTLLAGPTPVPDDAPPAAETDDSDVLAALSEADEALDGIDD